MSKDLPVNIQEVLDVYKKLNEQDVTVIWESDACPICSLPLEEHRIELTPIVTFDKKVLAAYSFTHEEADDYCFTSTPPELLMKVD